MDVAKLREVISKNSHITRETTKNIVCKCIYCGDHPNKWQRETHLYVSIDPEIPVVHCFLCNHSTILPVFIKDLTGDRTISETIIPKSELQEAQKSSKSKGTVKKLKGIEVPDLDIAHYFWKDDYIKKRSDGRLQGNDIPKIIYDFETFWKMNNLEKLADEQLGPVGRKMFQDGYIGILSRNDSLLYCRNTDETSSYKFRKIQLQDIGNRLDYVTMPGGNPNSTTVVCGEGPFDIIGEYAHDSLGYKNRCRMYACGLSFSYRSLLRSICYDEALFKVDMVILSDTDKKPHFYKKFKRECSFVLNSIKIYYNRNKGGDFGSFPIYPIEAPI